jgi:hypothetical protein
LSPVSTTPGKNVIASVVDTGNKLFTGVNDTGDKLFAGVKDIADKLFAGINDTPPKIFPLAINFIDKRSLFFLQNYLRPKLSLEQP